MMTQVRMLSVALLATGGIFLADGQSARPSGRVTTAESGLVGIRLYDTGTRVVQVYGSPNDILALSQGGSGALGSGSGPGAGSGSGAGGGGGTGGQSQEASLSVRPQNPGLIGDPFGTGQTDFRQLRPGDGEAGGAAPERGAGGAGGGGGREGAEGGGATGGGDRVLYTRWVYKRPNAHYSFVFDKFNRVVQIEALGLADSKVRTRKSVSFGAHFNELIKKYGAPDAYEINGDNIVVRYLVKDRVAFRLSRTRPNVPHHVTGIVVAAGKA